MVAHLAANHLPQELSVGHALEVALGEVEETKLGAELPHRGAPA